MVIESLGWFLQAAPLDINLADLNLADISKISPEVASGIVDIIFLIKTIGVILAIYIVFLIISIIMNIIRNVRIKRIYNKVYEIDSKLDSLLKSDKTKGELLKKLAEKKAVIEKKSEKPYFHPKSLFSLFSFNRNKDKNKK